MPPLTCSTRDDVDGSGSGSGGSGSGSGSGCGTRCDRHCRKKLEPRTTVSGGAAGGVGAAGFSITGQHFAAFHRVHRVSKVLIFKLDLKLTQ
jgi:hypothetical protein